MRIERFQTRRMWRFLVIVLFSLLLAACGADEADEEPTATSAPPDAQPTVVSDVDANQSTPVESGGTSVPENVDMSSVESGDTPGQATPLATPEDLENVGVATPASTVAAATPAVVAPVAPASPVAASDTSDSATPAVDDASIPEEAIPADADVGDGTTGAIVPEEDLGDASGTPASTPAAAGATPVDESTSAAPLSVTGCEVADVPPFTGEVTAHSLTTDLNFRVGPGAECDLALSEPIGAFMVVEVTGGPVVREDDGSEWVQIETLGIQGWVAYEFLEPVDE